VTNHSNRIHRKNGKAKEITSRASTTDKIICGSTINKEHGNQKVHSRNIISALCSFQNE